MAKKRLITGRDGDMPEFNATVETYGRSIPQPREVRSDQNQLKGDHAHGTNKGKKTPMRDKLG